MDFKTHIVRASSKLLTTACFSLFFFFEFVGNTRTSVAVPLVTRDCDPSDWVFNVGIEIEVHSYGDARAYAVWAEVPGATCYTLTTAVSNTTVSGTRGHLLTVQCGGCNALQRVQERLNTLIQYVTVGTCNTGQSATCTPGSMVSPTCSQAGLGDCLTPKVVLVEGWSKPADLLFPVVTSVQFDAAQSRLAGRGWHVIRPTSDFTQEDLGDLMARDRCVRGVYINTHGTPQNEILLWKRDLTDPPPPVSPNELSSELPTEQLDMLTVIGCHVRSHDWTTAFPNSQFTPPQFLFEGLVLTIWEWVATSLWGHGASVDACQPLSSLAVTRNLGVHVDPGECGSFSLCESTGDSLSCGTELFSVHSCADSIGTASEGVFSLVEPTGEFSLTVYVPPAFAGTVGCAATYFRQFPGEELVSAVVPIGRFLLFSTGLEDSLQMPDSVDVSIKYTEEDLQNAQVVEQSLQALWNADDGLGFVAVPANVDTLNNVVTFRAPTARGVVGLYGDEDTTDAEGQFVQTGNLVVSPNPFRRSRTANVFYGVPRAGHVRIDVFDVAGRRVRSLVNGTGDAGGQLVAWDGADENGRPVGAGIYLVRMWAPGVAQSRKLTVLW